MKYNEGTHLSSAAWGNEQRHFCCKHGLLPTIEPVELHKKYTQHEAIFKQEKNFPIVDQFHAMMFILETAINVLLREHGSNEVVDVVYLYRVFNEIGGIYEAVETAKYSSVSQNWYIK